MSNDKIECGYYVDLSICCWAFCRGFGVYLVVVGSGLGPVLSYQPSRVNGL